MIPPEILHRKSLFSLLHKIDISWQKSKEFSGSLLRGTVAECMIEEIQELKFKNKKAAAFGSYGWSGESTKIITESLKSAGFEIVDEGLKECGSLMGRPFINVLNTEKRLLPICEFEAFLPFSKK